MADEKPKKQEDNVNPLQDKENEGENPVEKPNEGEDDARNIDTMKTKEELKDVFCGINSLFMIKGGIEDPSTIDFEFDMPVLVDSLNYSEGEPTKNSVKIQGLSTDWCTMFESGETTFSVSIPTMDPSVLEFFWGKPTDVTSNINGANWEGHSYPKESKQIKFGFGILSGDGEKMFIIKEVEAVASNVFESATTQPHLVNVSGSVTSGEFIFLKKKVTP